MARDKIIMHKRRFLSILILSGAILSLGLLTTNILPDAHNALAQTPVVTDTPTPAPAPTGAGGSGGASQVCITQVGDPASKGITAPGPLGCAGGGGGGGGNGNLVYYCQGDPKWNGDNYPEFGSGNTCMLQAGCGPTSLAMIISTFGPTMTPVDVDRVFQSNGWRVGCDAGSSYGEAIFSSWFSGLGFTVGPNVAAGGQPDLQLMKQFIDQGNLIINGADNYPCLGCINPGEPVGHIFVIDDVDVVGKRVHTRDPNNCDFSTGNERQYDAWVMVAPDSVAGPDTSPYNASGATWNGSFPIKK